PGKFSGPDLLLAGLPDAFALMSRWILIDRDDLAIREDVANGWGHVAHVVAGNQWRRQPRPDAHMSPALCVRHVAVADLQHVGIVPVSGPAIRYDPVLTEAVVAHRFP